MNCMRCGRKAEGRDVFCPDCLADMEKYPVKPGVVYIPARPVSDAGARSHKGPSLEEQLALSQRRIKSLRRWVAGLLAALLLCGAGLALSLTGYGREASPRTRNYTTGEMG